MSAISKITSSCIAKAKNSIVTTTKAVKNELNFGYQCGKRTAELNQKGKLATAYTETVGVLKKGILKKTIQATKKIKLDTKHSYQEGLRISKEQNLSKLQTIKKTSSEIYKNAVIPNLATIVTGTGTVIFPGGVVLGPLLGKLVKILAK